MRNNPKKLLLRVQLENSSRRSLDGAVGLARLGRWAEPKKKVKVYARWRGTVVGSPLYQPRAAHVALALLPG